MIDGQNEEIGSMDSIAMPDNPKKRTLFVSNIEFVLFDVAPLVTIVAGVVWLITLGLWMSSIHTYLPTASPNSTERRAADQILTASHYHAGRCPECGLRWHDDIPLDQCHCIHTRPPDNARGLVVSIGYYVMCEECWQKATPDERYRACFDYWFASTLQCGDDSPPRDEKTRAGLMSSNNDWLETCRRECYGDDGEKSE